MSSGWNCFCRSATCVASAPPGSHAELSFFSTPVSLPASGSRQREHDDPQRQDDPFRPAAADQPCHPTRSHFRLPPDLSLTGGGYAGHRRRPNPDFAQLRVFSGTCKAGHSRIPALDRRRGIPALTCRPLWVRTAAVDSDSAPDPTGIIQRVTNWEYRAAGVPRGGHARRRPVHGLDGHVPPPRRGAAVGHRRALRRSAPPQPRRCGRAGRPTTGPPSTCSTSRTG